MFKFLKIGLPLILCAEVLFGNGWHNGDNFHGAFIISQTTDQLMQNPINDRVDVPEKEGEESDEKEKQYRLSRKHGLYVAKLTNPVAPSLPSTTLTVAGKPNFTAVTFSDTHAFPPDSMGAVGPTQFIAVCNNRIRSFNKTTGAVDGVLNTTTDAFFSPVLAQFGPGAFTSDPRIRYDRATGTWFIVMLGIKGDVSLDKILIAYTKNQTITTNSVWKFFSFGSNMQASGHPVFIDFPTLGIDSQALYIGANIFDYNGNFVTSNGYVIPKQPLITSNTLKVTEFQKLLDPVTRAGMITPQGVDNFDINSQDGYFVGVDNQKFGRVVLRRVLNPGTTPQISGNIYITVLTTSYPLSVPHKGNSRGAAGNLESIDDRLGSSHVREKHLFTAHSVGCDNSGVSTPSKATRNGCRWYEIDLTNIAQPTLVQAGTVFDNASSNPRYFWMPSVMTNGLNSLALGCSTAGVLNYANAAYAIRYTQDAKGALRAPFLYTNTTSAYNPPGDIGGPDGRRWGDYSHVSLDPEDNMTMWTVQEFCNQTNSYGVQALCIQAASPPQTITCSPTQVSKHAGLVQLTISGTSANGQAFYNPPLDFSKHLAVLIGDVTISQIVSVTPTQVVLKVQASNATTGAKNIVITNPDGQSVTKQNGLTVVP